MTTTQPLRRPPAAAGARRRTSGEWGTRHARVPKVVEDLTAAGMIEPAAPLPHRRQEVRAMAAMFCLPE